MHLYKRMHKTQQWSLHGYHASEEIPFVILSRGQIQYLEIHEYFSHYTKYPNFAFINFFTKVYRTKHSHGQIQFLESILKLQTYHISRNFQDMENNPLNVLSDVLPSLSSFLSNNLTALRYPNLTHSPSGSSSFSSEILSPLF